MINYRCALRADPGSIEGVQRLVMYAKCFHRHDFVDDNKFLDNTDEAPLQDHTGILLCGDGSPVATICRLKTEVPNKT